MTGSDRDAALRSLAEIQQQQHQRSTAWRCEGLLLGQNSGHVWPERCVIVAKDAASPSTHRREARELLEITSVAAGFACSRALVALTHHHILEVDCQRAVWLWGSIHNNLEILVSPTPVRGVVDNCKRRVGVDMA